MRLFLRMMLMSFGAQKIAVQVKQQKRRRQLRSVSFAKNRVQERPNQYYKSIIRYDRTLRFGAKERLTQSIMLVNSRAMGINGLLEITNKKFQQIGRIIFAEEGKSKPAKKLHLSCVRTEPAYQGGKIFIQMLSEIISIAKKRGIKGISLEVDESNTRARAVYAKAGFVEVSRKEPLTEGQCETRLRMEKKL